MEAETLQTSAPFLLDTLPFPPLTKAHILSCSYDRWYPAFRAHTPKARIITLPRTFVAYLRADGIILPPDTPTGTSPPSPRLPATRPLQSARLPRAQDAIRTPLVDSMLDESEATESMYSSRVSSRSSSPVSFRSTRTATPPLSSTSISSAGSTSSDGEDFDPSIHWRETHARVHATIAELGGKVVPKLNWSAPKDATQFNASNDMLCRTPGEIYLLLKASDFVSHDLNHALDGCADWPEAPQPAEDSGSHHPSRAEKARLLDEAVTYVLVLRKHFSINPSLEFRAFVRGNTLVGISQRDLNHYPFLDKLRPRLTRLIHDFFQDEVKGKFAAGLENNFTFDVYVPPPYRRVWLLDFNPWDRRTDPGLWSWLELLTMPDPAPAPAAAPPPVEQPVRLHIRIGAQGSNGTTPRASTKADPKDAVGGAEAEEGGESGVDDGDSTSEAESLPDLPELRLVGRHDPEAYMFNSTRYSAHKLPREVVDASQAGIGGMQEFAREWRELVEGGRQEAIPGLDTDSE